MSATRIPLLVLLVGMLLTLSAHPLTMRSVHPKEEFVSSEGAFTIKLPSKADLFIVFASDPRDQHTTGGMYSWDLKQGLFTISFTEFDAASDNQSSKQQMLSTRRNETVDEASTRKGELLVDQARNLGEYPGWELRVRYPGELFIERTFCANRRFYKLGVTLEGDKRKREAEALKLLDSFNVVNPPKP
jgi:hypothetical protein